MADSDGRGNGIFSSNGNAGKGEGKELQEKLLEAMYKNQQCEVAGISRGISYALRGSVLSCRYGTKYALLDLLEDYGIVKDDSPVCTVKDVRVENIHDFGSCLCPERLYKDRCPMTEEHDLYGNPAEIAFGNESAHICVPIVDEQGWKQVGGKVLAEIKGQEYAQMLLEDAVLVCKRGGIIYIKEVPDTEILDLRRGSRLGGLTQDYIKWLSDAEGSQDFIVHPFRVMSEDKNLVTIGRGITFNKESDEERKQILLNCFGWDDTIINDIVDSLYPKENQSFGEDVKEVWEVTIDEEGKEKKTLKNRYYTKYSISQEEIRESFIRIAPDYRNLVNNAIRAFEEAYPDKDTNYSQQQLEAMFDVAYNQGLQEADVVDKDQIIYHYLDKNRLTGYEAVSNKGDPKQRRRRINQMYLFFFGVYDFADEGTDQFKHYEEELSR